MSTKKLSDVYLKKEVVLKNIELLETRLEMAKNTSNKNKKNDKKLAVLEDSKNEMQNRLHLENQKSSNIQQKLEILRKTVKLILLTSTRSTNMTMKLS